MTMPAPNNSPQELHAPAFILARGLHNEDHASVLVLENYSLDISFVP